VDTEPRLAAYGERIARQYDRMAAWYDHVWDGYVRRTQDLLLSHVSLPERGAVLDAGCGTGRLLARVHAARPHIDLVGIDISAGMLKVAQQRIGDRARLEHAPVESLPFDSESVHLTLSANAFHYYEQPEQALREVRRVLVPGGRFAVVDWNRSFKRMRLMHNALLLTDRSHRHCYHQAEAVEIIEQSGFEITQSVSTTSGVLWGLFVIEARKPY
jgi:ubiquinone/menaquinone biosynthesis C-methylase UbiE